MDSFLTASDVILLLGVDANASVGCSIPRRRWDVMPRDVHLPEAVGPWNLPHVNETGQGMLQFLTEFVFSLSGSESGLSASPSRGAGRKKAAHPPVTTTGPTIDLIASGDEQDLLFEPAPELKKASRAKKVYWYAIYNGSKVGVVKGPWDRGRGPKEITHGYSAPTCQKFESFSDAKKAYYRHRDLQAK